MRIIDFYISSKYLQNHETNRKIFARICIFGKSIVFNPKKSNEESHHQQILEAEEPLIDHHRQSTTAEHDQHHQTEED